MIYVLFMNTSQMVRINYNKIDMYWLVFFFFNSAILLVKSILMFVKHQGIWVRSQTFFFPTLQEFYLCNDGLEVVCDFVILSGFWPDYLFTHTPHTHIHTHSHTLLLLQAMLIDFSCILFLWWSTIAEGASG